MIECVHSDRCGGCALIGLPTDQQHSRKRERVQHALARYSSLATIPVPQVVAAEPALGYRTRAKLVVSASGEIGLFARGGHEVLDIPRCRVLAPALLDVVAHVRTLLRPGAAPLSGLDLREVRSGAQTGVLVTLLGPNSARAEIAQLAARVAAGPHVLGVAFSARDRNSPQLLGTAPETLIGMAVARDSLDQDGPYHYAAHGGFTQAHRGQASAIVRQVVSSLQGALGTLDGARVLELYAGAGALALRLAQLGARPLLVERFAPALAHAARAAEEQQLGALRTRAADAEMVLAELLRAGERFDAILVNPPRRGLTPLVRARLAALAPRALVYISCDPGTLARDLADLERQGLAASQLTAYDMMPMAADVESLVLLQPAPPLAAAVIYEDDELLVVDKPAHVPTVPVPEHARSLLGDLKRAHGLSELCAVHRLDLGTSGVCLFAKRPASVSAFAGALAAGQKHYLALVRGRAHPKGIIKTPLREAGAMREATTRYTRVEQLFRHSLLRVRPAQGRTHQVRKHLASISHPVLGDVRYGDAPSNRHFEHKYGLDRTFLHLSRVELVHPRSGQPLVLNSELAPDLAAVRDTLRDSHAAPEREVDSSAPARF